MRSITIGITVIVLFVLGLLVGGVRVIEVPGYGDHGQPLMVIQDSDYTRDGRRVAVERITEDVGPQGQGTQGWVMQIHPVDEIRNKPWFIAQVLTGPVDLVASWGSVIASRPKIAGSAEPMGARSHARTNELGVLYTAVAGMLNLLAIIDAAHRAGRGGDE